MIVSRCLAPEVHHLAVSPVSFVCTARRRARLAAAAAGVAAALVLDPATAAQPLANECSDPHWTNTLRCDAAPTLPPQPEPIPPATPA